MEGTLNKAQQEAVDSPLENVLVLAGAGSGKTRVLEYRTWRLLDKYNVSPYSILAVTFTNKAAAEMRGRIEGRVGLAVNRMWVGTFHGIAHRLLRSHWKEAGLEQNFQIMDSEDQYRMVRRLLKSMGLDEKQWPPRQVQSFINGKKDKGQRSSELQNVTDYNTKTLVSVYQAYEDACKKSGLVDFAELLLTAYEMLRNNEEVLAHYQSRFSHILVDEFQDTNAIQYAFLSLLAGKKNYLFVVGDDDQSIYGWRGAQIQNIQKFSDEFKAKIVRLEQNYRSTSTILDASNALIANNSGRLGKKLWTDGNVGEPVSLYVGFNELDEARFIVEQIRHWTEQGKPRNSVAVLYRSNAQSRVLEEALIYAGLPYRIYGGLRFFDRAEIKDAMAYLRLLANRHDDAAFERVVNTPARGIGQRSMGLLRETAREHALSLWQAAMRILELGELAPRAENSLTVFVKMIDLMEETTTDFTLAEQVEYVIEQSGLVEHYKREPGDKAQTRIENLDELVSATGQFIVNEEYENLTALEAFLSHAALEAGESQAGEHEDCVQLMTLHSAKGLEFPLVFLSGVEEGVFPHHMSAGDPNRLEEERRLCYVGMTRAMEKLVISYAENRRLHGNESHHRPSRFISEIPSELIQEIRIKTVKKKPTGYRYNQFTHSIPRKTRPSQSVEIADTGWKLGQRVNHRKFGEGVILNCEGQGEHTRVEVNFKTVGNKWLVLAYANLAVSETV